MSRLVVLLLSLVLAMPVQAVDLQGLYEQALTASRQGDFVEALPLWDRFLEQVPEDAAALSNRGNVRLARRTLPRLLSAAASSGTCSRKRSQRGSASTKSP